MKKLILTILLGIFISSGVLFAYSNKRLDQSLNLLSVKFEKKYTVQEQIHKYKKIYLSLQKICPLIKTRDTKSQCTYIVRWMKDKIQVLEHISRNSSRDTSRDTSKDIKKDLSQQEKKNGDETAKHIPNVDMQKVREAWVSWHNTYRKKLGLHAYQEHQKLNHSSFVWAKHLAGLGTWTHKRKSTDGFYNYWSIKDWFAQQGVVFHGKGTLFTENIGLRSYTCKKSDCTDVLIAAIKKSFHFFMSEKNTNGPHYRAIAHRYFDQIGLGIYVKDGKYYLVSHYGKGVRNND